MRTEVETHPFAHGRVEFFASEWDSRALEPRGSRYRVYEDRLHRESTFPCSHARQFLSIHSRGRIRGGGRADPGNTYHRTHTLVLDLRHLGSRRPVRKTRNASSAPLARFLWMLEGGVAARETQEGGFGSGSVDGCQSGVELRRNIGEWNGDGAYREESWCRVSERMVMGSLFRPIHPLVVQSFCILKPSSVSTSTRSIRPRWWVYPRS